MSEVKPLTEAEVADLRREMAGPSCRSTERETYTRLLATIAHLTAERDAQAYVITCGRRLNEIPEDPVGKRMAWQAQSDDAGRFALFLAAMRDVSNLHDCVHRLAGEGIAANADRDAVIRERDEARAALKQIRDTEGKVCDGYDLCAHRACMSSYHAWAIAADALSAGPAAAGAALLDAKPGKDGEG